MNFSTIVALPKKMLVALFITALVIPMAQAAATVEELERRIVELERLLNEVKQQQSRATHMEQEEQRQEAMVMQELKDEVASAKESAASSGFSLPENSKLSFYGSVRPALTYLDHSVDNPHDFSYQIVNPADPHSSIEVTDFFTLIGVKGETNIGYGLTAFASGEMEVAIDQDGDFDPRLAFAGVEGAFGRLAIGRQHHPHYNTIAEVTDLYNHRSSPFGYDRQGPFRRPNLVTYSRAFDMDRGSLKLDAGVQFSKDSGSYNAPNTDRPGIDSGSVGLAFKNDQFYLGASYLERKRDNSTSRHYYGIGASMNVTDSLYVATTVQKIEQDRVGGDENGHSIDLVGSYAFGNDYKLIAGWFDVDSAGRGAGGCPTTDRVSGGTTVVVGTALTDTAVVGGTRTPAGNDDNDNCGYTGGYNLTLQRQISDNFRVFVEWLHFEYDNNAPDQEDSVNAISTGIRYDFSLDF